MVIVFSVLIALAMDAWWEDRGDRSGEQSYLVSLAVELDSLSAVIDMAARRDSVLLDQTEAVLRVLRDDQPPTPRADSIAAIFALGYSVFDPPTGTLRLLSTSDQVAYLRSEEIRAALRAAEGALVRTETLLNRTETEVWSLAQRYATLVEQLWESNGCRLVGGSRPLVSGTSASVHLPLDVQRGSPELRGIYQSQVFVLQNRIAYLDSLKLRIDGVREIVG